MAQRAESSAGKRAARAVVAVATLQVVAAVATAIAWFLHTAFAGEACHPACDWTVAELARLGYLVVVILSFVVTAGACVHAWRTARDLAWVPVAGAAIIVVGFFVAIAIFDSAVS